MELHLQRFFHGKESSIGYLRVPEEGMQFFIMEDEFRENKVKGQMRIPSGKYEVKFRQDMTPLTIKYRKNFDWFVWHLHLRNVKGFKSIYIHVGNYDTDSEGCLLVGNGALLPGCIGLKEGKESMITDSRNAYRKLYMKVKSKLDADEKVYILITNK